MAFEDDMLAAEMAEQTPTEVQTPAAGETPPAEPAEPAQQTPPVEQTPQQGTQSEPTQLSEEQIEAFRAQERERIQQELFGGQDLSEVSTSYKDLKTNLPKIKSVIKDNFNPFVDDDIKGFNVFVKNTGLKDFGVYQDISKFNPDESNPLDAMVLAKVINAPKELRGREESLKTGILDSYGVDSFEDLKEDGVKYATFLSDSADAKQRILSYKEKMTTPTAGADGELDIDAYIASKNEESEALHSKWETALNSAYNSIKENKVVNFSQKISGMDISVDIPVTEEVANRLQQEAMDFVSKNELPLNEENARMALNRSYNTFLGENVQTILTDAVSKVAVMTQKERDDFYHQIKKTTADSGKPSERPTDTKEAQAEALFNVEFGSLPRI